MTSSSSFGSSRLKPVIFHDHVLVQGVILRFDPEKAMLSVKEESHNPHNAALPPQAVYCIDFELKPHLQDITFTIEIQGG